MQFAESINATICDSGNSGLKFTYGLIAYVCHVGKCRLDVDRGKFNQCMRRKDAEFMKLKNSTNLIVSGPVTDKAT